MNDGKREEDKQKKLLQKAREIGMHIVKIRKTTGKLLITKNGLPLLLLIFLLSMNGCTRTPAVCL